MTSLTSIWTAPGFTDERIEIFLATGLTRGEAKREADEFIEVVTLPMSRVLRMIEAGEITDAKTIVGVLFAAGFRTS
jgi:ADP-ribose pyrophosphatase